jgi:hypothetical protein
MRGCIVVVVVLFHLEVISQGVPLCNIGVDEGYLVTVKPRVGSLVAGRELEDFVNVTQWIRANVFMTNDLVIIHADLVVLVERCSVGTQELEVLHIRHPCPHLNADVEKLAFGLGVGVVSTRRFAPAGEGGRG